MIKTDYPHVPYGKAVYGQEEIDAVVKALQTSTQMGPHVAEMEQRVAALFNKKHGVMVNSGSSANYLAIELLNLPPKSEIITPALTFSTTVAPIIRNKLIPVFVDVEEATYNIDAAKVEAVLTPNTRAMMVPNLLGNLPDWQELKSIAGKHGLILIEDSADTLGATINSLPSGRFTDISTTSFYGSHVINCAGNGGMLCVNSDDFLRRAKLLRSWGRSSSLFKDSEAIENRFNVSVDGVRYDAKFVFEALGYNLEPSEIGAAFGIVQLKKLSNNIAKRVHWFNQQTDFFKKYQHFFILPEQLANSITGWLAFPLIVKDNVGFTRTDLQIFLEKRNIQTRTIFTGNILRQPGFSSIEHRVHPDGLHYTDQVMRGGMLLACHHGLTDVMIEHLHESVDVFMSEYC